MKSNIVAFLNVLEGCWHFGIDHLVYASSSRPYRFPSTMAPHRVCNIGNDRPEEISWLIQSSAGQRCTFAAPATFLDTRAGARRP
ncbi:MULTISPECIES: hypothetical protein [unclassified Mesorhizobium]|uniref:hypothetical protein n=1 Tax=unclassified Mesorhizobium TaxID=325217 RepID=UPI0019D0558A|nr:MULTISPECIES: hypothetical protein [unclassified Mesorhizobium]